MPKVRQQAAELVRRGWSTREVARHFGYSQSAVVKWFKKAKIYGYHPIPTQSSKPKRSPNALDKEIIKAIIGKRIDSKRRKCGLVIYEELKRENIKVSLSSVQRTLDRCYLLKKRSPWKRPHDYTKRPLPAYPGALIQVDTIHLRLPDGSRLYVYTLIDLFSRWAYAEVTDKINTHHSISFIRNAVKESSFKFEMIQTDHGPEFSKFFTQAIERMKLRHRHSRVRKSNDNAHVERFNRTIQEECLDHLFLNFQVFKREIPKYLNHYNNKRIHMGIDFSTPNEILKVIPRC